MKKFFLFIVFAASCLASFSQYYILDKRSKVKKSMNQFYAKENRKYIFSETDSTITYTLNDSLSLPLSSVFNFNEQNRCIQQDNIFSCDSCLQKSIQGSLDDRHIKWEKVSADSYYAGFPYNVLMSSIKQNGQFIIRYTHLRRKALKDHKEE